MIYYTVSMEQDGYVSYRNEDARIANLVVGVLIATVGSIAMISIFLYNREHKKGGHSKVLPCLKFPVPEMPLAAGR